MKMSFKGVGLFRSSACSVLCYFQ